MNRIHYLRRIGRFAAVLAGLAAARTAFSASAAAGRQLAGEAAGPDPLAAVAGPLAPHWLRPAPPRPN